MKKEWLSATLMTVACLVFINGGYTAVVLGMARLTPQRGLAKRIKAPDGQLYYLNVAQKFTLDRYFWPRPSAVDYNAAGSGGSNKGPSNPDYLLTVSDRIDSFVARNPGISRNSLPSELVTASGSGLDPDISPAAALVQIPRIARARGKSEGQIRSLVSSLTVTNAGGFGPPTINVLQLNLAVDELQ